MPAFHDITAAVIGAGFIGPVHVEGLRRAGVRVKGIAGISADEATRAAATLGLPHAYPSVDALLADPEVKSVHVASPNRLHHDHVLAVLKAGKHVVCEKPLAMTSAQTSALVAEAKARPAQIAAVNYNLRFYPLSIQARAMVKSGSVGPVLHVHGSYVQDWLLYPTDFNWRVLRAEGGELRAVGGIGTHWLDLVTFITGQRIEAVMADLKTVHATRLKPPSGSIETFAGKQGAQPVERELLQPIARVLEHLGEERRPVVRADDAERRERRSDRGRHAGGGEEEGARLDPEEVDHLVGAGDEAAARRERLRERAHPQVDAVLDPEQLGRAGAAGAEHAGAVRLVDHQPCPVLLAEVADLRQRRDVALHREDAVDDDQHAAAVLGRALERAL